MPLLMAAEIVGAVDWASDCPYHQSNALFRCHHFLAFGVVDSVVKFNSELSFKKKGEEKKDVRAPR